MLVKKSLEIQAFMIFGNKKGTDSVPSFFAVYFTSRPAILAISMMECLDTFLPL